MSKWSQKSGVSTAATAGEALEKIASSGSEFASRGDQSGTYMRELSLWKSAGTKPSGDWYLSLGQGMGATLNTAIGMKAYVLTDRATWSAFKNRANHAIMVKGDKKLFNQYGVILVNPAKHPNVRAAEGQTFIDWLTGPIGQAVIGEYRIEGRQAFFPNAAPGS